MPLIGEVDIRIIEEDQSRWLAFSHRQLDLDEIPSTMVPKVMDDDKLKPIYRDQNLYLDRMVMPEIFYTAFNMQDPVVGGMKQDKIALRRAVAMSFNEEALIKQVYFGQARLLSGIVPTGVMGFDPKYRSSRTYDLDLANKVLNYFGYKRGVDGWRTTPEGLPLKLVLTEQMDTVSRQRAEIWKQGLNAIGINSQIDFSSMQNNLRAASQCRLMIWDTSWQADYPDGDNFVQLLYGPNTHKTNRACYNSLAYNELFLQSQKMQDWPKRVVLFNQMSQQMEADAPWVLHVGRVRNWVVPPWVLGFKQHPIMYANWRYLDLNVNDQKKINRNCL